MMNAMVIRPQPVRCKFAGRTQSFERDVAGW